jgi:hypothetical protein
LKKRENIKNNSEFEFVKNSDRPEVANELYLSGERQALFTGNLNKNSIRAIWVSKDFKTSGEFAPWQRMTLNDFIKKFDVKNKKLDSNKHNTYRVFNPRDKFDSNTFIDKVLFGHSDKIEFLKEITPELKKLSDHELLKYVWPNQLDDLKKFIDSL